MVQTHSVKAETRIDKAISLTTLAKIHYVSSYLVSKGSLGKNYLKMAPKWYDLQRV